MTQQTIFYPLGGGMDLVTPAVALPPGRVVASLNYEPVASGYRRLRGFDRYDGQKAPGDASYFVMNYINGEEAMESLVEGDHVMVTIGVNAQARFLYRTIEGVGPFGPFGSVVLAMDRRDVAAAMSLPYYGVWKGIGFGPLVCSGIPPLVDRGEVPGQDGAAWLGLAQDYARELVQAVPGSGPVRGVWFHNGKVLAIRDDADGTAGIMHRNYTSGWFPVRLSRTLPFTDGGPFELLAGMGVYGTTTGAYSTIVSVELDSGSWAAGDAAGILMLAGNQYSAFTSESIAFSAGHGGFGDIPDVATVNGDSTAYALPPGGAYKFMNHNFHGASDLTRMYGVNGVGSAFEYDDVLVTLTPLPTGMAVDVPVRLAAHRQSLFLGFPGGSVQFSQVGEPSVFDPVVGAGEIGIGSEIADLLPMAGALVILGESNINILYGSDSEDYQLEVLTREAGALPHTAQKIGQLVYMDNRGLRSLEASQAYGNFAMGTLSRLVAPLLEDYRRDGIEPVASLVCRTADQYWLFFDNGTGIIAYLGGASPQSREPQILPFDLGKTVTCCCSVEDDGEERLFIGCDDGFVYELNKGTSFDGEPIEHYLRLPFNHFGSPRQRKRIHKIAIDLEASGSTNLSVSADLDYGAAPGIETQQLVVTTGGGAIDSLGSNELYFASQIETRAIAHLDGVARNVSLKIGGLSTLEEPHTLTGITFHVSPRGLQR